MRLAHLGCLTLALALAPLANAAPFEARAEDATLNGMIERWGQESGWRRRGDRDAPDIDFRRWRGEPLPEEAQARSRLALSAAVAGATDFPEALERLFRALRSDPELSGKYLAPAVCLWPVSRVFTLETDQDCGPKG